MKGVLNHFVSLFVFALDDHNRIVLDPEPGVSESDYINASYINVS